MTTEATPGGLTTLGYFFLQVAWEPNSGRVVHPVSYEAINEHISFSSNTSRVVTHI